MLTLADALAAVESGNADVAAGDALVGAYLLRDHASLSFAGQMGTASPLGVAVSIKQPKLEAEVRATLDRLASEGVLETLRRKWVGDLQVLSLPDAADDATSTP